MITVNLLPEEFRPIKRTPLPHLAAIVVLVLAVLFMGKVWMGKQAEIVAEREAYQGMEQQLDTLKSRVERYEELVDQKANLEKMVAVIKEITDNRIIWSERLHQLTSIMPKNIWLATIKESTKRTYEQKQKMDEKGAPMFDANKNPVMERVNVVKPILEVQGYARESDETQEEVQPYIDAIEKNEAFSSQFLMDNPKLGYKEDDQGNQVRTFAFEFTIEPKPAPQEASDTEAADGDENDA